MSPDPRRGEWNTSPEPFYTVAENLLSGECRKYVENVDTKPGGALDALRVELRQYIGTVPAPVVETIYAEGLGIRDVGGYKYMTISRPERTGGSLDESEVIER